MNKNAFREVKEKVKVEDLAFRLAKNVIGLVLELPKNEVRFEIGRQLLRSGTSIGANIEEAQGGLSKKDFIHSMNIAKKEARETIYWLRLLADFDFVPKDKFSSAMKEAQDILRMLTSIVKTSQQNC